MNDLSQIIEHLRAAQPHMKAMGDALDRYSEGSEAIEYIRSTRGDLSKLVPIITEMIDVVSDELGCATELEDARDVLTAYGECGKAVA
ncbi:hypothetical protein UFOVP1155_62 [uncultured Caudovirales phage]|uniref:Uncharacterized protein n=1 Tax=uncultured Caudovirales phage TaxID=2100421 RepID=A0A6J5QT26_9CAUD|nr:hypothetical protein UFOVP1155_62 [uncultured Caudovirales phage]